jgi:hypothetical protein
MNYGFLRPKCVGIYLALREKNESANRKNGVMRKIFMCLPLTKYSLETEVKGFEMDQDFSTCGELVDVYNIFFGIPEGKDQVGDISVDGRRVLKWVLKKQGIL